VKNLKNMLSNKGLREEEVEKLITVIRYEKPFLLELRKGENGSLPFNGEFCEDLEVSKLEEKMKIIEIAKKQAKSSYGIQSLFQNEDLENKSITFYQSCFIDFNNTSDKVDFINAIQFLTNDNLDSFIEKIKEEQCTQATISFPTIY